LGLQWIFPLFPVRDIPFIHRIKSTGTKILNGKSGPDESEKPGKNVEFFDTDFGTEKGKSYLVTVQ
jgi:hypothetical protein